MPKRKNKQVAKEDVDLDDVVDIPKAKKTKIHSEDKEPVTKPEEIPGDVTEDVPEDLVTSHLDCNTTVKILAGGDHEFLVHTTILEKAQSPFIDTMMSKDWKESISKEIDWSHIGKDTILKVLEWLYTEKYSYSKISFTKDKNEQGLNVPTTTKWDDRVQVGKVTAEKDEQAVDKGLSISEKRVELMDLGTFEKIAEALESSLTEDADEGGQYKTVPQTTSEILDGIGKQCQEHVDVISFAETYLIDKLKTYAIKRLLEDIKQLKTYPTFAKPLFTVLVNTYAADAELVEAKSIMLSFIMERMAYIDMQDYHALLLTNTEFQEDSFRVQSQIMKTYSRLKVHSAFTQSDQASLIVKHENLKAALEKSFCKICWNDKIQVRSATGEPHLSEDEQRKYTRYECKGKCRYGIFSVPWKEDATV